MIRAAPEAAISGPEADVERLHRTGVFDARVQHGAELDRTGCQGPRRAKGVWVGLPGVAVHAARDVDCQSQLAGNVRQRAQHLRDLAAQRRRAADAQQPVHDAVRRPNVAGQRPRVVRPDPPPDSGCAGRVNQRIGGSRARGPADDARPHAGQRARHDERVAAVVARADQGHDHLPAQRPDAAVNGDGQRGPGPTHQVDLRRRRRLEPPHAGDVHHAVEGRSRRSHRRPRPGHGLLSATTKAMA